MSINTMSINTMSINTSNMASTNKNIVKFTPADFERIKNNGFVCPLSPQTIAIIQSLADQVGAPEYIKTPQFEKRLDNTVGANVDSSSSAAYDKRSDSSAAYDRRGDNRRRRGGNGSKNYELSDEAWEGVRNFKATLMVKKEGMAAVIDQIRKHLNKMTAKTYDTLRDNIIKEIEGITEGIQENIEYIEDEEFIAEINKIGEALFTIASGNSFYSNMYAKLYKELMAKFGFMKTIFETNFKKFNTLFQDFTYCDPNKDYDQFCLNNKVNEKRRALSLFYVNLMKEELIDVKEIRTILEQIQTSMLSAIKEPEKKNIVDEMAEIVYIIIVNGHEQLKTLEEDDGWENIEDFINTVSVYKVANFPSITNKTIFKFMDILDVF